jgi:hypothetical protein
MGLPAKDRFKLPGLSRCEEYIIDQFLFQQRTPVQSGWLDDPEYSQMEGRWCVFEKRAIAAANRHFQNWTIRSEIVCSGEEIKSFSIQLCRLS